MTSQHDSYIRAPDITNVVDLVEGDEEAAAEDQVVVKGVGNAEADANIPINLLNVANDGNDGNDGNDNDDGKASASIEGIPEDNRAYADAGNNKITTTKEGMMGAKEIMLAKTMMRLPRRMLTETQTTMRLTTMPLTIATTMMKTRKKRNTNMTPAMMTRKRRRTRMTIMTRRRRRILKSALIPTNFPPHLELTWTNTHNICIWEPWLLSFGYSYSTGGACIFVEKVQCC